MRRRSEEGRELDRATRRDWVAKKKNNPAFQARLNETARARYAKKVGRPVKPKAAAHSIDKSDPNYRELLRAKRREYYQNNLGRIRAEQRAWHLTEAGQKSKAERKARAKANRPNYQLARNLKKGYGLTIERYNQMFVSQKHRCAICRKPETAINPHNGKARRLAVDHHHASGATRGLLCTKCNLAIGAFNGDVGVMIKAIAYLEKHGLFSKEELLECEPPPKHQHFEGETQWL